MLVSAVVAKLSPDKSKPVNMTISASKTAKLFVMVLNYTPDQPQIEDYSRKSKPGGLNPTGDTGEI